MRWPIILPLVSLYGCKACVGDLPNNDHSTPDQTGQDTGEPEDTAPVDTGPPPPCDTPEVEPNDTVAEAQDLPLESWACGDFDKVYDYDILRFTTGDSGWLRMWARAVDQGSAADVKLIATDSAGDYTLQQEGSPHSSDPYSVVPIPEGVLMYATLGESFLGYGPDYTWDFIASMTKAPTDWDLEEIEDNDALDRATPIESGQRVYGVINGGEDRDWYRVSVPEGRTTFNLTIEAWNLGSPLDAHIYLYDPDQTKVRGRYRGDSSSDLDPVLDYTSSEPGIWSILVKAHESEGSPLYWYVLQVDVDTEPITDTGL